MTWFEYTKKKIVTLFTYVGRESACTVCTLLSSTPTTALSITQQESCMVFIFVPRRTEGWVEQGTVSCLFQEVVNGKWQVQPGEPFWVWATRGQGQGHLALQNYCTKCTIIQECMAIHSWKVRNSNNVAPTPSGYLGMETKLKLQRKSFRQPVEGLCAHKARFFITVYTFYIICFTITNFMLHHSSITPGSKLTCFPLYTDYLTHWTDFVDFLFFLVFLYSSALF